MPKFQPKVIWDSNPDFRINPDPDVCRIWPKMLWMHYLVGISHFAKYGTNQPLTVREMLTNVQKSPIPQWWKNALFHNGSGSAVEACLRRCTIHIHIYFTLNRNYWYKINMLYHLAERCQHRREWPVLAGGHQTREPGRMPSVHPRSPLDRRTPAPCPRTRHVSAAAEPPSVERRSSTSAGGASAVCCDRRCRRLWLKRRCTTRPSFEPVLFLVLFWASLWLDQTGSIISTVQCYA